MTECFLLSAFRRVLYKEYFTKSTLQRALIKECTRKIELQSQYTVELHRIHLGL